MKNLVLALGLVALVIGSVSAGQGTSNKQKGGGPVLMQPFAGPLTVVSAQGDAALLQLSFNTLAHISVTAPAGTQGLCTNVWAVVQADMDGDGFHESYPPPIAQAGCWMANYQFDAWGFKVIANNDQLIPWQTQANATVTYNK